MRHHCEQNTETQFAVGSEANMKEKCATHTLQPKRVLLRLPVGLPVLPCAADPGSQLSPEFEPTAVNPDGAKAELAAVAAAAELVAPCMPADRIISHA